MKIFIIAFVLLFGAIGITGWMKNRPKVTKPAESVQEIALGTSEAPIPIKQGMAAQEAPEVDLIPQLFALDSSELPIVETISFTSRVPWLKDRPAWIADYASHYQTSRHFIARSLNKKADYFTQKVHPGDRFNVFKPGRDIKFHLVVDLSKSRMWFYYLDGHERVLLKTYRVGLGKKDTHRPSGSLTPVGKYMLGENFSMLDVAIAPLLWRLDYYGIDLSKNAAPLLKYAERIFSRPAYIEALTPSEKVMRK